METASAIDMHFHWIPPALARALRARQASPMIRELTFHMPQIPMRLDEGFEDPARRIDDMDRHGVEHAVISFPPGFGIGGLPLEESLALCRLYNDAVAEVCAAHPDRFSAFAALPMADLGAAGIEFERAMAAPGMVGALVPGDGFLTRARAERFRPLFAAADARAAMLFVHAGGLYEDPASSPGDVSDNALIRIAVLDFQTRLSANMVTFCFTDFLAEFPNVTVVSHNLGGNFPFEIDRIDYRSASDDPEAEPPSRKVLETRFLLDCNSMGPHAIAMGVGCYGPGRIMFGSDGTELGILASRAAIAAAPIDESEKRAILRDTAAGALARVSGRLVAARA